MRASCLVIFFLIFVCSTAQIMAPRSSSCPTPKIKNGKMRSRQRGRILRFFCNGGFQLVGEKTVYCQKGAWDVPIPKCVASTCPKKEVPPVNGYVLPSFSGGALNYYCKPGFNISGPSVVYCDGVSWDNHKPACLPTNTTPPLFCDFEDANICHWTQDLNHDLDWSRDSYSTPSGYSIPTGPAHDHTKGKGEGGYYMYLESSSRRPNDTARLISPIFGKTFNNTCLEFWYHMFGKTTGSLNAYMRKASEPWPTNPQSALFTKSGNQGNVWYRAFVNLGVVSEDYQIIIEGVRGNGYESDIAIDDVKIVENCVFEDHLLKTTTEITTEVLKSAGSCKDRCGLKSFGNETAEVIPCDCDYSCFTASKCCPDFSDFCFASMPTSEIEGTTLPSETVTDNLLVSTSLPSSSIPPPTSSRPTRRPIVILQRPTTPQIVQKLYPDLSKPKNTSKIVFVKPSFNDVNDVPQKSSSDEEQLLTSPPDDENVSLEDKEDYVEKLANDKDLYSSPENLGKIKTEFRQTHAADEDDNSNLKMIFVAITAVCGVAVVLILSAVLFVKFRERRARRSGHGDSQSDVRFLTADEVLDFSLDKEYDDL